MNWRPYETDAYYKVWISEDGHYFLAKYGPMIFGGWRLAGGYMKYLGETTHLEICCGKEEKDFLWILARVIMIIDKNLEKDPTKDPFRGIPQWSLIKPYPNCEWFLGKIEKLLQK